VNSLKEDLELCAVHSSKDKPSKPNTPLLKGGDTAYIPLEYESVPDFSLYIRLAVAKLVMGSTKFHFKQEWEDLGWEWVEHECGYL